MQYTAFQTLWVGNVHPCDFKTNIQYVNNLQFMGKENICDIQAKCYMYKHGASQRME